MRIVVDLQGCQNGGRGRGIGRYAMALTRAMASAGRGHELHVVVNAGFPGTIGPIRDALRDLLPQDHILAMSLPDRVGSADVANAWRTRAAEIQRAQFLEALEPDLVFTPSLFDGYHDRTVVSVEPGRAPTAATVYDFIPMDHPDVYLPSEAIRAAYLRKLADARRADLLLPISDYVAAETVARLGVAPERVVSAPLGVEPHFRPAGLEPGARAELMARCGIARPFVLNTSPPEFRKNLGGLIAGFGALSATARARHQLVIVGRMAATEERELRRLAAEAGLARDALVLPGFVPEEDLVGLYGACELFAFPSFSEGFGLPVLEAMACGAPVIGAATTSIPEVIGRDDLLFDPHDAAALGALMERVLGDGSLQAELRAYGPARAAPFTWERTAATVLDAFERLARSRPSAPSSVASARRLRLALVVGGADSLSPRARSLLDALGASYAVTLVREPAAVDDAWTAAVAERIEPSELAGLVGDFDRIALMSEGAGPAPVAPVAEPSVLHLHLDAPGVVPAAGLRGALDMAQGRPMAAVQAEEAALPATTMRVALHDLFPAPAAALVAESRLPGPGEGLGVADRLRQRIEAATAQAPPDPARRLAAALPSSVRGVVADARDLADLALSAARNEALARPPRVWLDVTALLGRPGPIDEADRALLDDALRSERLPARAVRLGTAGFEVADAALVARLGVPAPDAPEEGPAAFRSGDRLLGVAAFGGLPPASHPAMVEAAEAGAEIGVLPASDSPAGGA